MAKSLLQVRNFFISVEKPYLTEVLKAEADEIVLERWDY